jgi:hypothetical protein
MAGEKENEDFQHLEARAALTKGVFSRKKEQKKSFGFSASQSWGRSHQSFFLIKKKKKIYFGSPTSRS